MKKQHILLLIASFLFIQNIKANIFTANPSNYTTFLSSLVAGDTLVLTAGNYLHNLTLNNINGTALKPIVITGVGNITVLLGQSGHNTISITKCSFLVIQNLKLDGLNQFVDAVKAEGSTGNWAHHITIEKLYIVNYFSDQQQVGISTKCSAWNWVIRKNKIIGSGTGMYLGNSDGKAPFVNGIVENNYVANTIGYNIQIKHQVNGVRDLFPGTQVNGFTIVRNNTFSKDVNTSSTGGNARPNLLVGGFPSTGWGASDYYEIYGNFFYNNPVEALLQGTGNIMLYSNIFVNHYNPAGMRVVYFTPQNGVSPQDIKVFHNTMWAANSSGGIRLNSPNTSYQQYCYANAVFSPSAITNFTNSVNNITDSYANAGNYVLSATPELSTLDLYPKSGQLTGASTASTLFQNNTHWDKDFNSATYNWTYRGAYSGCCENNGWNLQLDTMPSTMGLINAVPNLCDNYFSLLVYPNPTSGIFTISINNIGKTQIEIYNIGGELIYKTYTEKPQTSIDLSKQPKGIYLIRSTDIKRNVTSNKIIIQ